VRLKVETLRTAVGPATGLQVRSFDEMLETGMPTSTSGIHNGEDL
jgi:methylmalonyl-CoA mutase N-terminal domain/subunit